MADTAQEPHGPNGVAPRKPYRPNLRGAVAGLQRAVNRLVTPSASYQNNTYIEIPGLYRQLIDALEGEQGAGANGVAKSRPPFWCDAADKKFDFDLIVEFNLPDYSTRGTITARLIALAHHAWTVDQIRSVRRIAGILNAWADDFEALLTHGHVLRLTAACPACGEETVHRYDSGGELIRDTALIATEAGAVCQSCEHRWGPSEFVELSRQLGTLPAGVLE